MVDSATNTTPNPSSKDWLAFLTYFIPIVLIYTMIKKGNEPAYLWHSKNAAGSIVTIIIIQILIQILRMVLTMPLLIMILKLASLALLVLMIYGAWQAANGKLPTLPVVTQIGQRIPLEKWFKGSTTAQSAAAPVPMPTPAPMAPTPAPMAPTPAPMASPAPTEPTPPSA